MAELRSIDPRALVPNPDNPRRTAPPKEMDKQLAASIAAIGLIHPPRVREIDGQLVIIAGNRRRQACIDAGLDQIDVYVVEDATHDAMASMSENLIRVGMNPVDTWRGIQKLEDQGWNEQAIGDALALPVRTVRKLKLLAKLHPPMLDFMAKGSMPNEEQLRTIAAASLANQAEVWKAHKPKRGHDVSWWEVSRALHLDRIAFGSARFDEALATEYGVVWEEDLFAPAGEDSRYTTNIDGFFGAQQAHMEANLPTNGAVLTVSEHGAPQLPKGAERTWNSKAGKGDIVGYYVDPRNGEVQTVVYRLPPPKKAANADKRDAAGDQNAGAADSPDVVVKLRPDLTQKGEAMVGEFRTEALAKALSDPGIPVETLLGLLTLALAADNVSVQSPDTGIGGGRAAIRDRITEGGVLTADPELLHSAARDMLRSVLSCRANMTNSGVSGRIAGVALNADAHLPHMATEEFLSCLSRQALERSAAAEGVAPGARVKDTRAALARQFDGGLWRFPNALFALTLEDEAKRRVPKGVYLPGRAASADPDAAVDVDEATTAPDDDVDPSRDDDFQSGAIAAE
jgi:ParB/RepB/Spo0J family partition protein